MGKTTKEARKRTEQKRQLKARLYVDELKRNPCTDCGNTFPTVAMDFDHVRGEKEASISHLVSCATRL